MQDAYGYQPSKGENPSKFQISQGSIFAPFGCGNPECFHRLLLNADFSFAFSLEGINQLFFF